MKRFLFHLIIPAFVAAWAVVSALRFEAFSPGMFAAVGILCFLYYSTPHLLWALVAALSKTSNTVCHAGFIAANVALLAIVSLPLFGVRDPSGLPLQWVAYWPFALVLQALSVAATVTVRANSSRVGA